MTARILIASEMPTHRIMLNAALSGAGYLISQARSAQETVDRTRDELPDVLLLDGGFSGADPLALCRRIKAGDTTGSIPIVVLTADPRPDFRLNALTAGADEILHDRAEMHVLLVRIRNLLRTRTLAAEVAQRQKTAMDLGFSEAPAEFRPAAKVLVVAGDDRLSPGTRAALDGIGACTVEVVAAVELFRHLETTGQRPDLFLLLCGTVCDRATLTQVAELRSRRDTRHAAIVISCALEGQAGAVSALDLGANDLIASDSLPGEYVRRVATQLAFKLKSDLLRDTFETGLQLAVTDPLTGLFNRRYALPHLARLAENSLKTKTPFAVMVLDLDRFKGINDRFGHAAGDAVLTEIADRLRRNPRSMDLLARIGGEEFLVAMPDTTAAAARVAAERLRRVTEMHPVIAEGCPEPIHVTVSIGLASAGPAAVPVLKVEELVDQADRALLSAKSRGRNLVDCVQVAA